MSTERLSTSKRDNAVITKISEIFKEATVHQQEAVNCLVDYFTEPLVDVQHYHDMEYYKDKLLIHRLADILGAYFCDEHNLSGMMHLSEVSNSETLDFILNERRTKEFIIRQFVNNSSVRVIIRFPKVRVSNEDDKFVDIKELYVKLFVKGNGTLGSWFEMVRSDYPLIQWLSKYSHSHLPTLYTDKVPDFRDPCLGSGPIYKTQERLSQDYDLDRWGLFAFELDQYVTQESLTGGPYIRLETMGKGSLSEDNPHYLPYLSKDISGLYFSTFLKDFFHDNNFPIAFKDGEFTLGCPVLNFDILLSNYFINWYNEKFAEGKVYKTLAGLEYDNILRKVIIDGNRIFSSESIEVLDNLPNLEGKQLYIDDDHSIPFMFKGKPITLHIEGSTGNIAENYTYLLEKDFCSYTLTKALKIINLKYGTSEQKAG